MKIPIFIIASIASVLSEPPSYLPPKTGFETPIPHQHQNDHASSNSQSLRAHYNAPTEQHNVFGGNHPDLGYQNHGSYGYQAEGYNSEPANYNFEYHVYAPEYGNDFGHQEERQGDAAQGKYFVLLPDGRKQTVSYIADQNGYNPTVSYEEGIISKLVGNYGNGGYPDAEAHSEPDKFYGRYQNQIHQNADNHHTDNEGYKYKN